MNEEDLDKKIKIVECQIEICKKNRWNLAESGYKDELIILLAKRTFINHKN